MLTEEKAFEILQKNDNLYDPLIIERLEREVDSVIGNQNRRLDARLILTFRGARYNLLIEQKSRTAPRVVEGAINTLRNYKGLREYNNQILTLLVPYLTESILGMLKENDLSGIDVNGNYYIVSSKLVAIRLDKKNKYPEQKYIKDIFSRKSSLVGRLLLESSDQYNKIGEVLKKIKEMGGGITLSTVSKVLSEMEDQLIISKRGGKINLLQPEKLLDKLSSEYQLPNYIDIIRVKLPTKRSDAKNVLTEYFGEDWIWTGESSADEYTSTPILDEYKVYLRSDNSNAATKDISKIIDERFFNCTIQIIPKTDDFVFFNSKNNYASKIQTYLELMNLDKREREIAADIKRDILNAIK